MANKRSSKITTLFAIATVIASPLVLAHHGIVYMPSLYLTNNVVEFQGEIVEVFWRYPHTRARMRVLEADGEERLLELEMTPTPREWEQLGYSAEDFLGFVRAAGFISRRDPDSLGATNILLPDGREYVYELRTEALWTNDKAATVEPAVDQQRAEEERRTAIGIFRTWGPRLGRRPGGQGGFRHFLSDRGLELAAQYHAPTDNPELDCRTGVGSSMMSPYPLEIIDGGDRITLHQGEYNVRRTVWLDPDASGVLPATSPFGFSVGRWENDTLIVHTTHIDFPYLDSYGTPQSDQIEYLERFGVSELDSEVMLNYSLTATDPVMYAEPIIMERSRRWFPGGELGEFDWACEWESDLE